MEQKRFAKNDQGFLCAHCGREVEPLGYSSRNHCPFCLWSLHLDVNPGDRASDCGGELEPIRVEVDARKGYIIVHKCKKCGELRRCRAAHEAKVQPDNLKLLIKLTAGQM
ncbi:MAG: RNHCP domain-containing protein [Ruminococcaceae bacterium]|nr:RNHCP domain-containing protein [Oscillospiraceae bacterium]